MFPRPRHRAELRQGRPRSGVRSGAAAAGARRHRAAGRSAAALRVRHGSDGRRRKRVRHSGRIRRGRSAPRRRYAPHPIRRSGACRAGLLPRVGGALLAARLRPGRHPRSHRRNGRADGARAHVDARRPAGHGRNVARERLRRVPPRRARSGRRVRRRSSRPCRSLGRPRRKATLPARHVTVRQRRLHVVFAGHGFVLPHRSRRRVVDRRRPGRG